MTEGFAKTIFRTEEEQENTKKLGEITCFRPE